MFTTTTIIAQYSTLLEIALMPSWRLIRGVQEKKSSGLCTAVAPHGIYIKLKHLCVNYCGNKIVTLFLMHFHCGRLTTRLRALIPWYSASFRNKTGFEAANLSSGWELTVRSNKICLMFMCSCCDATDDENRSLTHPVWATTSKKY